MPSASKAKGNSWERDVCEHLSGIYGVNFQRVPNSGAFLGQSNFHRAAQLTPEQSLLASGDVILPGFLSHISLECKFYKDFKFENLLTESTQMNTWIEQASVGKKIPFVIFKINRKGGFVVFPSNIHHKLSIDNSYLIYNMNPIVPVELNGTSTSDFGNTCEFTIQEKMQKSKVYTIVKMENFFEANKDRLVALDDINYTIYQQRVPVQNSPQSSSN